MDSKKLALNFGSLWLAISLCTLHMFPAQAQRTEKPLMLLTGKPNESAGVVLQSASKGLYRNIEANFDLSIGEGGEEAAFTLLNEFENGGKEESFEKIDWSKPGLKRSLQVVFTTRNPPTQDYFNKDGNFYDRPQREVALFWDGTEIVRKLSSIEYRTGAPKPVKILIAYATGGAEVSLSIAGAAIYSRFFIAEATPYESRPAFSGRGGATGTKLEVSKVDMRYSGKIQPPEPPVVFRAVNDKILDKDNARQSSEVPFPVENRRFGRIICTLTLSKPEKGFDPWDRKGAVYVYDEKGERFELLRFITPYHRGFVWKVDVSDFRPLLTGKKKIEAWCETYGTGWNCTVEFAFYPGKSDRYALKVQNLWTGNAEIGNPDKPVSAFFTPKEVLSGFGANSAKLRLTITGHGQAPNDQNAAEFMPSKRTVSVGETKFENLLWKEDCYLNPCRPQGGTWKFDRAGWAPGDIVRPWEIELKQSAKTCKPLKISYDIEPYVNSARGKGDAPHYWTESVLISYGR